MGMNGKTIGRTKPEPDMSRVESVAAFAQSASDGTIEATSPRERALNIENNQLRRELAVMTARAAVMNMGGKPGSTRPIGFAHERLAAFEDKALSTLSMTEKAKLVALEEMANAVKSWRERETAWKAEVEMEVAENKPLTSELLKEAKGQWGGNQ